MTFELLRGKNGRIEGLVLRVVQPDKREYWRICESCTVREAVVFCRSHVRFVCEHCIERCVTEDVECAFISSSVARELATVAMIRAEV